MPVKQDAVQYLDVKGAQYILGAVFLGYYMLSKEDLLNLDEIPLLKDISLALYKDFSCTYLLPRLFVYHLSDGTTLDVKFEEWGIHHMLSIQHVDNRIKKEVFFRKIDNGLDLSDFTKDNAVKLRFKREKKRIVMFACTYNTLRRGKAFYVPSGKVQNTGSVAADYILYRELKNNNAASSSLNGMNIGIRKENGKYVPLTVLISKQSGLMEYVDPAQYKAVEKLEIFNEAGDIIETITYDTKK